MMTSLPLDRIKLGDHVRADLGDIPALADSIKTSGLMCPLIVTASGELIAGDRRLAAVRSLGWITVPVIIVDRATVTKSLGADASVNTCKKALSPYEAARTRERRVRILGRGIAPANDTGYSDSALDKVDRVRQLVELSVVWRGEQQIGVPPGIVKVAREVLNELTLSGADADRSGKRLEDALDAHFVEGRAEAPGGEGATVAGAEEEAGTSGFLGRKSVLVGMAASMGIVFANAAQTPAVAAGTAASRATTADATDVAVASLVGTSGSLTRTAIDFAYAPANVLPVNVKDVTYGAKGDGAVDDTTALTEAFNAARASGAEVLIPPGVYMVSAQLNPAGCTIRGYGATLKSVGGITGFSMLVANSMFSVFGLTIDHDKANTTYPGDNSLGLGIYVYLPRGGDAGDFIDCRVINAWGAAIRIGSVVQADSQDALNTRAEVRNLTADNTQYGIFINGGADVTVTGGHLTNLQLAGVQDNYSARVVVSGVTVDAVGSAGLGTGILSQYGYVTRVIGNHVSNCGFAGIVFGGGSIGVPVGRYFTIAGNVSMNNYYHGITLDPTISASPGISQSVHSSISGNVCANNGLVSANGYGINIHNAADVSCTGNICHNNTTGIVVDGSRVAASGNTCTDNALYGMQVSALFGTDHGGHAIGQNVLANNAVANFFESRFLLPGS